MLFDEVHAYLCIKFRLILQELLLHENNFSQCQGAFPPKQKKNKKGYNKKPQLRGLKVLTNSLMPVK